MDKIIEKIWSKKIWLIMALAVFIIQLLVPAYMIYEKQRTLSQGTAYNFRIMPIDPYDPFRGRYVVLSFEQSRFQIPLVGSDKKLKRKDWIYAILGEDEEGFAKFTELRLQPPQDSVDYIRTQIRSSGRVGHYKITVPFDRYYSPENKAIEIENQVRQRSRQEADNVYVRVKVYQGKGTIEDLYINQVPILEFVELQ